MYTSQKLLALLLTAILGASSLTGCSEDSPIGNTTAIFGTVQDPFSQPIPGILEAVVYEWQVLGPAPEPAGRRTGIFPRSNLTPAALGLSPPYPNPMEPSLAVGQLTIPVTIDADTTVQVQVLANFGGVLGTVANLFSGTVTADTAFVWNGRSSFDEVAPNGIYLARVTIPANPPSGVTPWVGEAWVLVNRSTTTLISLTEGFNAISDVAGEYVIDDIAVESRFTLTNGSGAVQGTAVVENRLTLLFWDEAGQYQPLGLVETILQGESLEKTTQLDPVFIP